MPLEKHTVKSYDDDLKSISSNLELMLDYVGVSIDLIVEAVKNPDQDYYVKIKENDKKINAIEKKIEKDVIEILALRQPMAVDLRFVTSALKVATNLERAGDQSKNIVGKIAKVKNQVINRDFCELFLEMADISKEMMKDAISSFNSQDVELANTVLTSDDKVDADYKKFKELILGENFTRNEVIDLIDLLFVAKSFERLADYAANIAEISKYVINGSDI